MKIDIFNTNKVYDVIYADPPWEYKQSGSKTNSRGMAKQHYPTMTTQDICNLPIEKISHETSLCFMWATFPNIAEALKVMESWGFIYKTAAFVWIKKNKRSLSNFWGMGAYTRANAEICLLGVKKRVKANEVVKSHKVHQVVESPVENHSKKPDVIREKITELLGETARCELFARSHADGWDCWGNEV